MSLWTNCSPPKIASNILRNRKFAKISLFFSLWEGKWIEFIFSEIDIFIGALDENLITNKHFVASRPYYRDRLTWCVQNRKPIPLWQNLLHICHNPIIWAVFFVEVMIEIGFVYCLEQFEHHPKWDWHRIFFDGLRIHMGFSCVYKPTNNATRVLFLFILFACTIFTITICSTVLEFITSPILSVQVKSITEIISKRFTLVGGRFELLKVSEQIEVRLQFLRWNGTLKERIF